MSSSSSPCAACKCLRRKCTHECVFAPYFPPDNPQKFTNVHKVFGASNVTKLLNELNAAQREDAVNSLAYEAEYRLRDPVYGCVGVISILQHKLKQVQLDLEAAKKELAGYIGPIIGQPGFFQQQQHHPNFGHPSASFQIMPYGNNNNAMGGLPMGIPHGSAQLVIREPQQQFMEAQQLAAREQEMMRGYEQQQQNNLVRYSGGFDDGACPITATAVFNQAAVMQQPSLALGGPYENVVPYHHIHQHGNVVGMEHPHQLLQLQQQLVQPLPRTKSEEGRSVGPSC